MAKSGKILKLILCLGVGVSVMLAGSRGQKLGSAGLGRTIPEVPLRAPKGSSIPSGQLGDFIRLGRNIIVNTPKYAALYTGNDLKCNDCHPKAGTVAFASPLGGVTTLFPAYSPRAGRVITIEDRLNECFVRSENGKPLPDDSRDMIAMVAYMTWLSRGVPEGSTVEGRGLPHLKTPAHLDPKAGARIYVQRCSPCHGAAGQGVPGMFPALWGPRSVNDGAGISKAPKMAAFVKANMPPTAPDSLTVQEAFDVSAFVDSHPRPHYNHAYDKF
jgi:thiosulfate dehydrogenase